MNTKFMQRIVVHPFDTSMLGSLAVVFWLSYHASSKSPIFAEELLVYFRDNPAFLALSFIAAFLCGVLLISVGYRQNPLAKLAVKITPSIGNFMASSGGAMVGWISGVAVAYFCADPIQHVLPAFTVFFLAFVFVGTLPLMLYYVNDIAAYFHQHGNTTLSPSYVSKLWKVKLCGILICVAIICFAGQHYF